MNVSNVLHLTLRELLRRIRARRLWAAFGLTILLFAIAAPFGTREALSPGMRLVFWTVLHTLCWSIGVLGGALGTAIASRRSTLRVVTISVAISAVPIAVTVAALRHLFLGEALTLQAMMSVLPVSTAVTAVMAANALLSMPTEPDAPATPPAPAPAPVAPPAVIPDDAETGSPAEADRGPRLLARLPSSRRGSLLRLSMQDHYVEVATDRGAELLLLRMGDAIAECAPVEGLQVHRSHWVARSAVASIHREGDKASIRLINGDRVPVSRGRLPSLREAGWLATDDRRDGLQRDGGIE